MNALLTLKPNKRRIDFAREPNEIHLLLFGRWRLLVKAEEFPQRESFPRKWHWDGKAIRFDGVSETHHPVKVFYEEATCPIG